MFSWHSLISETGKKVKLTLCCVFTTQYIHLLDTVVKTTLVYFCVTSTCIFYLTQGKYILWGRAVARRDNWGGGRGSCSHTVKTIAFKRNPSSRTRTYKYEPLHPNYRSSYGPVMGHKSIFPLTTTCNTSPRSKISPIR